MLRGRLLTELKTRYAGSERSRHHGRRRPAIRLASIPICAAPEFTVIQKPRPATKEEIEQAIRNMPDWRWQKLLDVLFSAAIRQGRIDEQGRVIEQPAPVDGGAQCQAG